MTTAVRTLQVNFRPDTPPAQAKEYLKCASDPVYFLDVYGKIQHKVRGPIPFMLWDWQAELLDAFQRHRFLILLKARQIGVSELAIGYALWLIRFHPTKIALVVSKNGDDADEMIQRATFAHDHLPPWLQAGPAAIDGALLGNVNKSTLEIIHKDAEGHSNPSAVQSLAATKKAGRSRAASLLILDEWAHQEVDVWAGAEGSTDTGGQVIGISTANGMGNRFFRVWTEATRKENLFRAIFLSWRKNPDRDEQWYAQKARNMESWELHQEYPDNPDEAFVQSGRPVYSQQVIVAHTKRLQREKPLTFEHEPGWVFWSWPTWDWKERRESRYVIGADVAEGLPHGDYSAAVVVDRLAWTECAQIHGHWPPEIFAQKLDELGRIFHNALLVVERNNHGHAVLLELKHLSYPNLYYHADPLERGADLEMRPGWPTTSKTKPIIITALGKALREMTYHTYSQAFLDEALIFSYTENGGMSAPDGMCDDLLMSRAIVAHQLTQPDHSLTRVITHLQGRLARQQQTHSAWNFGGPVQG